MAKTSVRLRIQPDEIDVPVAPGTPLAIPLKSAGLPINYPCGGAGRCAACRVRFLEGAPPPAPNECERLLSEDIAAGWRLACQCTVTGETEVVVPSSTRFVEPRILTASGSTDFPLDPPVLKLLLNPRQPAVTNPLSDRELVDEVLVPVRNPVPSATLEFLQKLPGALRGGDWKITVTERGGKLVDVEPSDTTQDVHGVCIDLGTTTIAASLHSLRTGEQLALTARINPQVCMGEDVITRLNHTFRNLDALNELQTRVVGAINAMTAKLCQSAGISLPSVYEYTIAGNAVMNHLLTGIPPETIGLAPYTPVFRTLEEIDARELGLGGNDGAGVFILPNIGGFVGGDTVAGLIVCDMMGKTQTSLLIDIGTNCEVVLAHEGELFAASAPAGPSLEGACIEFGMRAEPGAIDDLRIEGGLCTVTTIEEAPAKGLCGSGLVHAIAALREAGVIQATGLFADVSHPSTELHPLLLKRLDARGPRTERFLVQSEAEGAERDVWLTQKDIREFQLARAAITSAWKTLCDEAETTPEAIEQVFVAGAFGNFIRPEAARSLGFTPAGPHAAVISAGNSSLEGARKALLNRSARREATALLDQVRFVELAGREEFDELFAMELALG